MEAALVPQNQTRRSTVMWHTPLHEVFAEVPEDSRVLSERHLWFPTSNRL